MVRVKCSYPNCKKKGDISRTPAKLRQSQKHFHDNECRLAYQHEYGFYGAKPDHSLIRSLIAKGNEYKKRKQQNDIQKFMRMP